MPAPETTQGPVTRDERIALLLIRMIKVYCYVLTVFFAAGVAAVLAHRIDMVLQFGTADWPPHRVQHIGWVVGAVLFAIGVPLGWCRVTLEKSSVSFGEGGRKDGQTAEEAKQAPVVEKVPDPPDRSLSHALRVGLVGGLFGFLFGFLLGCTLSLIWVSIALSPWAPAEWVEALHVGWSGVSTSHPMAIALWLGTMAGLGVLGFVVGFVGAPLGWASATWPGKLPRNCPGSRAVW